MGIANVRFIQGDLEKMKLADLGRFDVVVCSGLLYHLPEPWKLIKEARTAASRILVWTHYVADEKADVEVQGYRGSWRPEDVQVGLSGLSTKAFWLTIPSLKKALANGGFDQIKILTSSEDNPRGAHVTIAAWSTSEA